MNPELKAIKESLEKTNRMLNQAQVLTHIGSWEMELSSGKIYFSDEALKIYGIQTEKDYFMYEEFLKLVHPEDISLIENMTNKPQTGKISLEFRMIKPDGAIRNIFELAEFLFNENGKPTHIIGTIQDITEKKELEKEIKLQQQKIDTMAKRFQALIRESTDVFEILAPDGTIIYISEACEQVIGYKPEERML
jgi:PAS domain S-box-containing protein